MEQKNVWETYSEKQLKELEKLNKEYREFLSDCKTERECVDYIVNAAEDAGYKELQEVIKEGGSLKKGDKVYSVWMNKSVALFNIGEEKMEKGMNILGAHIDSPRLDIKQNPLYEDGGFAYLDTHYYGGVKKYQWVTIPLAIHGVVVKKDGTTIELNIGENEDDPVFFISDLLIHLAQEQLEKKAAKVIEGEALDIIIGNKPLTFKKDEKKEEGTGKDAVKKGILSILKDTYDMDEEDFISAELEVVPAGKAREAGFDRSMILSYGQDDRVCAFTSLKAMLEMKSVKRTSCCLLVDKEEIGSVGATGMQSHFFENMVADYIKETGNHVLYRVTPVFSGDNLVASGVHMEAESVEDNGNGILFNVYCFNAQPGIAIDYATGDSHQDDSIVADASKSTTAADANVQTYILNTNTKKFHKESCNSAKSMDASNKKIYTGSRQELIDMGYEACGVCKP